LLSATTCTPSTTCTSSDHVGTCYLDRRSTTSSSCEPLNVAICTTRANTTASKSSTTTPAEVHLVEILFIDVIGLS
jgi:hypothetical protein